MSTLLIYQWCGYPISYIMLFCPLVTGGIIWLMGPHRWYISYALIYHILFIFVHACVRKKG